MLVNMRLGVLFVIALTIPVLDVFGDTLDPYDPVDGPVVASYLTVSLSDVTVNGTGNTTPTAATGAIYGNDDMGGGNPLLGLLNGGGSVVFNSGQSDTVEFTSGLFDVQNYGMIGTALGAVTYAYGGKRDVSGSTSGSLPLSEHGLTTPFTGSMVVSLKAGNQYAVYAFADVENATTIYYTTNALLVGKNQNPADLSHSVGYLFVSLPPNIPPEIPGPNALAALLGMGAMGLIAVARRRRRNA